MKEIICSGALFYAKKSKRFLFLHRTQGKQKDLWGLVGGTNEDKETPWSALQREIKEENEFIPTLNIEHNGYAWVSFNKWPKPLHQGLRNTLSNKVNLTKLETVFKLIDLV